MEQGKVAIPTKDFILLRRTDDPNKKIILPDGVDAQKAGVGSFEVEAVGPDVNQDQIRVGDEVVCVHPIMKLKLNGTDFYFTQAGYVAVVIRNGGVEGPLEVKEPS